MARIIIYFKNNLFVKKMTIIISKTSFQIKIS